MSNCIQTFASYFIRSGETYGSAWLVKYLELTIVWEYTIYSLLGNSNGGTPFKTAHVQMWGPSTGHPKYFFVTLSSIPELYNTNRCSWHSDKFVNFFCNLFIYWFILESHRVPPALSSPSSGYSTELLFIQPWEFSQILVYFFKQVIFCNIGMNVNKFVLTCVTWER